jgi:YVTN family beta-propeller protein
MKNIFRITALGSHLAGALLSLTVLSFATTCATGRENYLSPQALVSWENENLLFVAQGSAKQVAVFNTNSAKVIETIDVPAEPTGLALSANSAYLYVTCAAPEGCLCVFETAANKIIEQIPVGQGARSPVLGPDGGVLYVCNRFSNDVSVINTRKNRHIAKINVLREPFAADITPDGTWLFVGNHLPDGPADAESVACKVSVVNTKTFDIDVSISLPNGSTALGGIAVGPDGRYVYVSHILARFTVPTSQLEQGWVNTNALSIIDAKNRELIETVLLDDVDNGAANPWAVRCTADGKYICVTHAGTGELSIIDAPALLKKIKARYSSRIENRASRVENELSFLYGIRQRIKLRGKGPRALAIAGWRVYVAEYFTDSITLVNISKKSRLETIALPLGPRPQLTRRRRGEMLFNDASLCFQQWQSCASCHPGGGRADALNWDLLNDGIGNPKNTKSLLLAHETPPAMITGARDRAETAVRSGIKHILFATCPEEDAIAIDEYLKSLKLVASPYLVRGKLSRSARRGQKVFDKAGCASCHKGQLYTDLQKYDVGTGKGLDKDVEFDTPTLVEIWRTAPYLYDGRAATMKEVLTTHNPGDKHGRTSNLTDNEINDLVRFVLSL